jgi:uncharacterized Fe-S radical SAM superfamily protein PflX
MVHISHYIPYNQDMVNPDITPRYVQAAADGRLAAAVEAGEALMHACVACGWVCNVDRTNPEKAVVCRSGTQAWVARMV